MKIKCQFQSCPHLWSPSVSHTYLSIFKRVSSGFLYIVCRFVITLRIQINGTGGPWSQEFLPYFLNSRGHFSNGPFLQVFHCQPEPVQNATRSVHFEGPGSETLLVFPDCTVHESQKQTYFS